MEVRRRISKPLTAAFVRTAKEPGKFFDGDRGNGLMLRVDGTGARYFLQRIAIHGKRREIGIGSADLVTLAQAREIALENRRLARAGGDPLQSRREAAAVLTFEEAARKVHQIHAPTWRNKKHAAQFLATLETYAFPRIGRMRVPEIAPSDVLAVLTPIWTEKPETARRVRQRIGTVMKWTVAQGWRTDNPAESISQALPKTSTQKKARKALPYDEVFACLDTVQASGAGLSTKFAFEFLVLTASRSGEVREARWSEIDLDKAVWTVPADRMKQKKDHRVPLSKRAIELLEGARTLQDGSGLVFPSARHGRPLSDNTLRKLIRKQGFDVDVHGFRTSFRTWAQERTNYPREVAEFALAHVVGDAAERAYARSDLFEKRRKMMAAWAAFVSEDDGKVARIG